MKNILCPTDFSEAAQNAIAYAAKLAQVTGARLVLSNVKSRFDRALMTNEETAVQSISEALEAERLEASRLFNISCDAHMQPVSTTLEKVIADGGSDYDLIVIGTHSPDESYRFLTDGNAYKASVKSAVPILLVPTGCAYTEIKTLVYAFDYLTACKLRLEQLKPWIKALKCEISILQVMEEAYSDEFEDELKELQFISRTLHSDHIKMNFETIRSYEIAESIHNYVLRKKPDMLALCAAHRTLLERSFHNDMIKEITSLSTYPVFIFHQ